MLQKTRGIVLHTLKYSETSLIIKVYTEEFGLQSYLAKGAFRKKSSSSRANLLQPLAIIEIDAYYKEKSRLQILKEVTLAYQYNSLFFDIRKSSIAIFLNEIIYKSVKEEEPNKKLYDFIISSIKILDEAQSGFNNFHLVFILQLTRFLGFYPRGNYEAINPYFDLLEGIYLPASPSHAHFISPPESEIFSILSQTPVETFDKPVLSRKMRHNLLEKIIEYYALHLPGMKEIKSHKVLEVVLE